MTALAVTAKSRSRTHCANGHEYTADNCFVDATGRRYCNICRLRTPATHCQRGHLFDEANTLVTKKGRRECRTCKREKARDWHRRNAEPKAVTATRTPREQTTTPSTPTPSPPSDRPAVTMPDTTQCQRCGDPADHNAGTADAICDPCQTRQHRRAARRRLAGLGLR